MKTLIVVNRLKDWDFQVEGVEIVSARSYLTDAAFASMPAARVYNLCRHYRYQSIGYYVSLLAEARGHKVYPNATTIQDFKSLTIVRAVSNDLEELIQKSLEKLKSNTFKLSIYFGKNVSPQYDKLSKQLFLLFQAPFLRAQFVFNKEWLIQSIRPIPLGEIPEHHKEYVLRFAAEYFSKTRFHPKPVQKSFYDLAILVNPKERVPPSDKRAIDKFIDAADEVGFDAEVIHLHDYSRIGEFDALFIRETTAVNHPTYRFSRRAHAEGMVVIDDPLSILKCTNKVYLAELLTKFKIPTPKTLIVHKDNIPEVEAHLGLPCVLKQPDSSFSQNVVKVMDRESLHKALEEMLKESDLLIAQEFMPTAFDWRIGVLDNKALFACKYYMAKGHWQIYHWAEDGSGGASLGDGDFETVPLSDVPESVLKLAIKSASAIGDSLYGVDLKQIGNQAVVIEVNDNPSIEAGVEDKILKEELYLAVMRSFMTRLQKIKKPRDPRFS